MKSLGEYLQNERQARGVSLAQISQDTRISINMLRAIEEGNVERLPAPVLVKGFLRAYAKHVGLDPEAVIVKYQDIVEEADARQEALERFHLRLQPEEPKKKGVVLLGIISLLIILALSVWWLNRSREQPLSPVPQETAFGSGALPETSRPVPDLELLQEQSATVSQQPSEQLQTTAVPQPEPEALNIQTPQSHSASSEVLPDLEGRVSAHLEANEHLEAVSPAQPAYVLRAETLETTWMRMIIDEGLELEYLLHPNEKFTWSAMTGFRLHIGNAAGVKLFLNGQPLKPLGQSGEVVFLKLPDPSLVVTSNPEHTEPVSGP